MERITISLDSDLANDFDALIRERGYASRSEAIRDLLRGHLQQWAQQRDADGHCIATLSFVYNHEARDLGERLKRLQHEHHELTVSSMHAHLDHDQCIETLILQGRIERVRRFAEAMIAERGVRHGQLNLIPVDRGRKHRRGGIRHQHLRPRH